MRYIIIFFLFLICALARGQSFFTSSDCGTWEQLPADTSEFKAIDTIGSEKIGATRDWVYDKFRMQEYWMTTMEYAPCGSGKPTVYYQDRICRLTGIKERRYVTIQYKYTPKPETEYEKTVRQLLVRTVATDTIYHRYDVNFVSDTSFVNRIIKIRK